MHRRWNRPLSGVLLTVALAAQNDSPAPAPEAAPTYAAVQSWLESDGQTVLRDRAVGELSNDARGLPWLAQQLRGLEALDHRARTRLRDLATALILTIIDEKRDSGVVFRGQYSGLAVLEPFASTRLLELLLQSPDWFDERRRIDLVRPIADVLPTAPSAPVLLGIMDVIRDTDGEPEDLRFALACLVWQWGKKEFIEARVEQLRASSTEGDIEDRLFAMRQLADTWYRVHEYAKAAATHRALGSMATAAKYDLLPTDWYWGACYLALADRVDDGLTALRRCAELLAAPNLDSSHRLPRKLFERDPEIARLRADPRFQAILELAFAPQVTTDPQPNGRDKDR